MWKGVHYIGIYNVLTQLIIKHIPYVHVYTVKPVYYGHLGTSKKCPAYQGVLIFRVILHD